VADAVDEYTIEIASLKALALHQTLKRNEGMIYRVSRGAFEKVAQEVCAKYNLDRSDIQIEGVW
jgi:hypothetical protein